MRTYNNTLLNVKVIDLFAGIGGFHYAFKSFGTEVIWACECDESTSKVYEKNHHLRPDGDITKIEATAIPDHDILCAGFPCQAFSISGKQLGFNDIRGTLFFDIVRIARVKQPNVLFLENVANLMKHNQGKTFRVIIDTIKNIGYNVYHKILNATDYGVPQSRKRLYIIAFRNDLNINNFNFPKPQILNKHLDDILLDDIYTEDYVINRYDLVFKKITEHYCNKPLRIGQVGNGRQGERIYSSKGTAITLSAYGGGIGAKTGLYKINERIRKLTPRECARLNGFPDTFEYDDNKRMAYQQFGNSVVIDVIQSIISQFVTNKEIMKCLI